MPCADRSYISEFLFEIPLIQEQKKIASILQAADEYIKLLSKCIVDLQTQISFASPQNNVFFLCPPKTGIIKANKSAKPYI